MDILLSVFQILQTCVFARAKVCSCFSGCRIRRVEYLQIFRIVFARIGNQNTRFRRIKDCIRCNPSPRTVCLCVHGIIRSVLARELRHNPNAAAFRAHIKGYVFIGRTFCRNAVCCLYLIQGRFFAKFCVFSHNNVVIAVVRFFLVAVVGFYVLNIKRCFQIVLIRIIFSKTVHKLCKRCFGRFIRESNAVGIVVKTATFNIAVEYYVLSVRTERIAAAVRISRYNAAYQRCFAVANFKQIIGNLRTKVIRSGIFVTDNLDIFFIVREILQACVLTRTKVCSIALARIRRLEYLQIFRVIFARIGNQRTCVHTIIAGILRSPRA